MNTPNKLTLLRIVLVPVFMALLLTPQIPFHMPLALLVFIGASVTDLIDGKLARARNQITNFGKLMDPLADKLLVTAALVCFVALNLANVWAVVLIVAREFLVSSIRQIAAGSGKIIAANMWGKVKTNSQMAAIICVMLFSALHFPALYGSILVWVAAGFTVVSGIQYGVSYREYLTTK